MVIPVATLAGTLDLLDPDPQLITPAAIAFGLAKLNRWAGSTELPISVAQHSGLVWSIFTRLFPNLAHQGVHALLHDAHEYLIGDQITPLAKLLDHRMPGAMRHVDNEKHRLDVRILEALGIPNPHPAIEVLAAVHAADLLAAHTEWLALVPAANGNSPYAALAQQYGYRAMSIVALPWPQAETRFRELLERELYQRAWAA